MEQEDEQSIGKHGAKHKHVNLNIWACKQAQKHVDLAKQHIEMIDLGANMQHKARRSAQINM